MMSPQSAASSEGERKPKRARRDHQMRMAAQQFDPESLMDMPLLAVFFGGKSLPTISRWRKDPDPNKRLPPPDLFMGAVPYWKRRTIIAYRDRLAELHRQRTLPNHSGTANPAETAPSGKSPPVVATRGT
jgi:hypothetical protein